MVYHTPSDIGGAFTGSTGLRKAFESNGYLNYAYDQVGGEFLDINKLQESPIFFIRGFLHGRMPIVARAGNQFKACWQSESFYTRHGTIDASSEACQKNQKHFNMMFTCAESDLELYDIPTYWLPSWSDTTMFKNPGYGGISDRLGFYGDTKDRADFLDQDDGLIEHFRTPIYIDDPVKKVHSLCEEMCKYEMIVNPPGRCFNGFTGRIWEAMACGRMVFQYLNEATMFKSVKLFKDGVDVVYFHDYAELKEKFEYYKNKPEERFLIAMRGHTKVREQYNQNTTVKYIIDCMKIEYDKWMIEQGKISSAINEAYAEL